MRGSSHFPCAVAGIILIGLLALSAVADRESKLSYFGAVDPSRVESGSDDERGAPDSCLWVKSGFETFAGISVPIRVTKRAQWQLGFEEMRTVTVHEAIASPGTTVSHPYVFVHLEISEDARNRIDALREAPCGSFVSVQSDGRDLDLAPIVGLGPGVLPGGSFRSREEAERFYGSIGERVSYVELSDEKRTYWQTRNDELVEIAVWHAKCDPDYLKSLGDGLYEHIMATPSLRQRSGQADCAVGPPLPIPPASVQPSHAVDRGN